MTLPDRPEVTASRKQAFDELRRMSTWRLLAAAKAPAVLAILGTCFPPADRRLGRSVLLARIAPHLELLTEGDPESRMGAADYAENWVREGFLSRRDDPDARESTYEPSPAAVAATGFVQSLAEPRRTTTVSRLSLVLEQLEHLASATETDRSRRLGDLQTRREAIETEIRQLSDGAAIVPEADASADRVRDILDVARGLSQDFHQYRADLRAVDLRLREEILAPEGNRGDVLEQLLSGEDLLGQSQVGRTFTAFFRLLNDPQGNARAQDVLDRVLSRGFTGELTRAERETLANVFSDLYEPAQEVLDVKTDLYRSLARFVRSQDFQQHRVLADLLAEAQHLALAQKDSVSHRRQVPLDLELSRIDAFSLSQWQLKDPVRPRIPEPTSAAAVAAFSAEELRTLARENEIDTAELTTSVNSVVQRAGQASIGEVLRNHPATQGLASIIGLMFLAARSGSPDAHRSEIVTWAESDETRFAARIPLYFFVDEVTDD